MDDSTLADRPAVRTSLGASALPRPGEHRLRSRYSAALLASLAGVGLLALSPRGSGWAWGSPTVELRWYLTGLDSTATMLQLVGNLALLAVPAALAVLRWPTLGRLPLLAGVALGAGSGIELLQRLLPLGRVVSPLDAVLNATGAIATGLAVDLARQLRPAAARRA